MNEQEQAGAVPTGGSGPSANGEAGQEDAKPRARRARGRRGGRRHKSAAARAAARAAAAPDAAEAVKSPPADQPAPTTPKAPRARREPILAAVESEGGAPAAKAKSTSRRRRSGRGRKAVTEEMKSAEAAPVAPPAAVPVESSVEGDLPVVAGETREEGKPRAKARSRRRRSGRGRKAGTEELKIVEAAPGAPPAAVPEESGVESDLPVVVEEAPQQGKPHPKARSRGRRKSSKPEAAVEEKDGVSGGASVGAAAAAQGGGEIVVELPRRKQILVSSEPSELRVAVVEDGRLAEILMERPSKTSCLGSIYKGKVDNVLAGMDAAFVDIGLDKNGFLSVDEVVPEDDSERRGRRITQMLRPNQEILVQVSKDPMGNKGARLTTKLSLAGRYLVYVPNGSGVGVSRRLKQDERDRLRDLGKSLDARKAGLIARTAAEGTGIEELRRDLHYLSRLWARLKKKVDSVSAPGLVYAEVDVALETVRDLFNESCESVVCDTAKRQKEIVSYLDKVAPELKERVVLHSGQEPLFEAYGIEEQISRALERRVSLPSGGNLVIDYTEALTVIDVNTGRYTGGKGLEDTTTKTNLEAAREVVRQLRLRDIGGIIVVDFIDMARARNREAVLNRLEAELETDRTKTYVVELSPLGLVEMTRQNTTDGARGILTKTCPLCQGKARVLSEETVALSVERSVRERARGSQGKAFLVEVNGDVAERLTADGRLKLLEKETGKRVFLESSQALPVDSFSIVHEGSLAEVEKQRIPVREGQEVELEIEYALTYSPRDAVGYVDGYMVIVEGGRQFLGKRRRVHVVTALRTGARATLVGGRGR